MRTRRMNPIIRIFGLLLAMVIALTSIPFLQLDAHAAPDAGGADMDAEAEKEADVWYIDQDEPLLLKDPSLAIEEDYGGEKDGNILVEIAIEIILSKAWEGLKKTDWGKSLNEFFGGDASTEEVAKEIEEITSRLKAINAALDKLLDELVKQEKREDIQKKLNITRQAQTHTDNYMTMMDAVMKQDEKEKILDQWFNNGMEGQKNMINFLDYYTRMVSNSDGNNLCGDFFSMYRQLGELTYPWSSQSEAFVAVNANKDLQLAAKIGGMAALWLAKEKRKAEGNQDRLEELHAQSEILREALQRLVDLYKRVGPVDCKQRDWNVYRYKEDLKWKKITLVFKVVNGTEVDEAVFKPALQGGKINEEINRKSEEYGRRLINYVVRDDGFKLLMPQDIQNLMGIADKQKQTWYQFLGTAVNLGKLNERDFILMGAQPHNKFARFTFARTRIFTVKVGKKRIAFGAIRLARASVSRNWWAEMQYQVANVVQKFPNNFADIADHGRYPVTFKNDNQDWMESKWNYLIMFIQYSDFVPQQDEAEDEDTDNPSVTGIISEINDNTVTLRCADGSNMVFEHGENTALMLPDDTGDYIFAEDLYAQANGGGDAAYESLPDDMFTAVLKPGDAVRFNYYPVDEDFSHQLQGSRIGGNYVVYAYMDTQQKTEQTMQGAVKYFRDGENGEKELLITSAQDGQDYTFRVPAGIPVSEEITEGAAVVVQFHETEGGLRADSIVVLNLPVWLAGVIVDYDENSITVQSADGGSFCLIRTEAARIGGELAIGAACTAVYHTLQNTGLTAPVNILDVMEVKPVIVSPVIEEPAEDTLSGLLPD